MDEDDLQAIVETGVRILRRVPMTIDGTDEFFDHLRAFGCTIDGDKVWCPDAVIDVVLDRAAQAKRDAPPFDPADRPPMQGATSGQAMTIVDSDTGAWRPAMTEDLATFSRVVDAVGLDRMHPTFLPQDAPLATRELHAFATIVLNSALPHRVSMYSHPMLPSYLNILETVCDDRAAAIELAWKLRPASIFVITPMAISRENVDIGMAWRRLTGQPLRLFSMPGPGMSTPITPAGSLALTTAECLACNAITLAVDDQVLGWSVGPVVFDMKSTAPTVWGPEYMVARAGGLLMAEHLFGAPPVGAIMGGGAAAAPGAQSAMERALEMAVNFMAGARLQSGLSGLATMDAASTVQLMIDVELLSFFQHAHQGFTIDPEQLAEQLSIDLAANGAVFFDTDHTLDHYGETFWPAQLVNRSALGGWRQNPTDMIESARQRAIDLERNAENQCPLPADQRRDIERILDEADAAAT